MNTVQPTANQDLEHLKLLSIFHYVFAGLWGLASVVLIGQLVFTIAMIFGIRGQTEAPIAVGIIILVFMGIMILGFWTLAICMIVTGKNLARQTKPTFCLVMACIECIFFPLGTALGVFTIIVLNRPSVKALPAGASSTLRPKGYDNL